MELPYPTQDPDYNMEIVEEDDTTELNRLRDDSYYKDILGILAYSLYRNTNPNPPDLCLLCGCPLEKIWLCSDTMLPSKDLEVVNLISKYTRYARNVRLTDDEKLEIDRCLEFIQKHPLIWGCAMHGCLDSDNVVYLI